MCGYNVGMLECVDTMLECVDMWILFSGLISFDRSDLNCCADENTQKKSEKNQREIIRKWRNRQGTSSGCIVGEPWCFFC